MSDEIDFSKEHELFDDAIHEVDELYTEVKTHYDRIKNSPARGTLTFIQNQTSNLISLKTTKASLLRDKLNVKKAELDFALKYKKVDEEVAGGSDGIINEIARLVINSKEEKININDISNEPDSIDIERQLELMEESGDITLNDNELKIKYEKLNVRICIEYTNKDKWNFIAIAGNGDVIGDYPLPKNSKISFSEDTYGNITASDDDTGIMYNVLLKEIG